SRDGEPGVPVPSGGVRSAGVERRARRPALPLAARDRDGPLAPRLPPAPRPSRALGRCRVRALRRPSRTLLDRRRPAGGRRRLPQAADPPVAAPGGCLPPLLGPPLAAHAPPPPQPPPPLPPPR